MWPYNLLAALRAELPRVAPGDRPRRIYLARPKAIRRSLSNEDALLDLLAGAGFTVVEPERLAFAEQVAALEAAEVIVAPHGSALLTLMFCHGTKRIVEVETKTSYRMALYNFLGHQAVRVPSRFERTTLSMEEGAYKVDLDQASQAIAWAVGR
jgi:capsular polysaccharide biosynthesis protein